MFELGILIQRAVSCEGLVTKVKRDLIPLHEECGLSPRPAPASPPRRGRGGITATLNKWGNPLYLSGRLPWCARCTKADSCSVRYRDIILHLMVSIIDPRGLRCDMLLSPRAEGFIANKHVSRRQPNSTPHRHRAPQLRSTRCAAATPPLITV
ncbi:hypothetical protein RR46_12266 [Papilio xuthus]|uniref:Uncharacterized protein n=1 Tax=Papilio xuthus TaxID=66420 RepID=A0A194PS17_PAPXU|nr:hypothetical protein RR46_12266 [Papilio xuthus]